MSSLLRKVLYQLNDLVLWLCDIVTNKKSLHRYRAIFDNGIRRGSMTLRRTIKVKDEERLTASGLWELGHDLGTLRMMISTSEDIGNILQALLPFSSVWGRVRGFHELGTEATSWQKTLSEQAKTRRLRSHRLCLQHCTQLREMLAGC